MVRATGWWLVGVLTCLLGAEVLCRMLPVSTATLMGYYIDPDILSYPARHAWKSSSAWDLRNPQTVHSNNVGFVAMRDFVPDPRAVALVGDSFVEASMLPAMSRPDALLEAELRSMRPVYSFGVPGSALLDYAERIRFAHERFAIRDFVVLMERGDVVQSMCGSGNVHAPCLDRDTMKPRIERLSPGGLAKRVLRHSALAQYVFGQLKVAPDRLLQQAIRQSRPVSTAPAQPTLPPVVDAGPVADTRIVDAVARTFFARIQPHVEGRLVIIVDSDRERIRRGAAPVDPLRRRFIDLARAAGAEVIDTEPLFMAHYARSSLRLEVGPHDAHLNPLGIGIVMHAAARALPGGPGDRLPEER